MQVSTADVFNRSVVNQDFQYKMSEPQAVCVNPYCKDHTSSKRPGTIFKERDLVLCPSCHNALIWSRVRVKK